MPRLRVAAIVGLVLAASLAVAVTQENGVLSANKGEMPMRVE